MDNGSEGPPGHLPTRRPLPTGVDASDVEEDIEAAEFGSPPRRPTVTEDVDTPAPTQGPPKRHQSQHESAGSGHSLPPFGKYARRLRGYASGLGRRAQEVAAAQSFSQPGSQTWSHSSEFDQVPELPAFVDGPEGEADGAWGDEGRPAAPPHSNQSTLVNVASVPVPSLCFASLVLECVILRSTLASTPAASSSGLPAPRAA